MLAVARPGLVTAKVAAWHVLLTCGGYPETSRSTGKAGVVYRQLGSGRATLAENRPGGEAIPRVAHLGR
jgi:hypothetical protein